MWSLWGELAPLTLVNAVLPVQTVVTLALVGTSFRSALAWVAGMLTVRLIQGFVFGFVVGPVEQRADAAPRYVLGAVLLVLALLLYVKALRAATGAPDEDAAPPSWIESAKRMSWLAAFGAGAGFMTISVKFLVFTLAAVSVIASLEANATLAALHFVLFVALGSSLPLTILVLTAAGPGRGARILEELRAWLLRRSRMLNVLFGVVFGSWFLVKALGHWGVL